VKSIVADCASDAPLGATRRVLGTRYADEVLVGFGALVSDAGVQRPSRLQALARHQDVADALTAAVLRLGVNVDVVQVAEAWPGTVGTSAAALVQIADALRGRPRRSYLTVAGAVEIPSVVAVSPDTPVTELVGLCGGASGDDWVAVAGGAPNGHLVPRDALAGDLGELVLILPTGHEVVRRLRTSLSVWLQRAASLCGGCQACSDACPEKLDGAELRPSDLVRALVAGSMPSPSVWSCTGCGLCDALCPGELSPRALVEAVRSRLSDEALALAAEAEQRRRALAEKARVPLPPGVMPPWSPPHGLDLHLLTTRLGLAQYDRPARALL